jgi:hypothetical protein
MNDENPLNGCLPNMVWRRRIRKIPGMKWRFFYNEVWIISKNYKLIRKYLS